MGRSRSRERTRRDEHDRRRSRSGEPERRHGTRGARDDNKGQERNVERSRSRPGSPRRRRSHSPERSRSRGRRHRSRTRSRSPDNGKRRRASRSSSSSASSSHSRERRRRKKEKKERKREKRERKEKKNKKKDKLSAMQWGKYGLINESDIYNKDPEFRSWLVEERMLNPETMPKDTMRKEFARFAEDFNTATLPHEKYYDMAAHEARMSRVRAGEFVPQGSDVYDPAADMRALESDKRRRAQVERERIETERESWMDREQLQELRRVQHERVQMGKMKILGMETKQNMGVRMDGTAFDG